MTTTTQTVHHSMTHATDVGDVIRDSIINLGHTSAVVEGYIQSCPRTRYKIALRASGDGWEALYDQGGDDCGISADDLMDIIAIGRMDDSNTTVSAALRKGAGEIESWAERIRAIDEESDALRECADYLLERVADARAVAEDVVECNALAEELGMDEEDEDEDEGQD